MSKRALLLTLIITLLALAQDAFAIEVVQDEEAENILYQIARPIYQTAGLDPESLEIFLVKDAEPNAFAADGQKIFITTGLLSFSPDPNVIAGVIAHEVGHIAGGHLIVRKEEISNLQKKMAAGAILGILAGLSTQSSDVAMSSLMASMDNAQLQYYSFSRMQESAADNAGARYMKKLGIENEGLVAFLKSLSSSERSFYGDVNPYARTHPLSQSRIDFINNSSLNNQYDSVSIITDTVKNNYRRLYVKIKAFTVKPEATLNEYKEDESLYADYAKAIAYFKSGNKVYAIKYVDKLLHMEPNNPYFNEFKGQILFENGSTLQSIPYFEAALKSSPKSITYKMALANALVSARKNVEKAISLIKQVLSTNRANSFSWHLLGVAYQAEGKKELALVAFAWEALLLGDVETAKKMLITLEKTYNTNDKFMRNKVIELKSSLEEGVGQDGS